MPTLTSAQLAKRWEWHPIRKPADCAHGSGMYIVLGAVNLVRRICRFCGEPMAEAEPRCWAWITDTSRRCMSPGRHDGYCRTHRAKVGRDRVNAGRPRLTRELVVRLLADGDAVTVDVDDAPPDLSRLLRLASEFVRPGRPIGRPRGSTIFRSIDEILPSFQAAQEAGLTSLEDVADLAGCSVDTIQRMARSAGLRIRDLRLIAVSAPTASEPPGQPSDR